MKQYNNFIVTGCSYSDGAIPPDMYSLNNPQLPLVDQWKNWAWSWSHFCLLELNSHDTNYVNFAMPSGGNVAAFSNLIYYLEINKNLNSSNTLIGFNITSLDRCDIITNCDAKVPKLDQYPNTQRDSIRNLNIKWTKPVIPPGVIDADERQIHNCLVVLQALAYLDFNKFNYFFMILNNSVYDDAPDWFKTALDNHSAHWVKFDNILGMYEFVKTKGLLGDDKWHPSKEGHELISKYVTTHLDNYEAAA